MEKKELLDLKADIETAKTEVSKLSGKKEYLMQQLKDVHGCASIEAAEKKIEQFEKKIEKISDKIELATQELKDKFEPEE